MSIHLGQILFIAILAFMVIYVILLRTAHTDCIVYLACALVGILLVLAPDLSTDIAHALGIGRGVDLIIYLFILAGLFYSITITSELKRLQRQMTVLIRQMALDDPLRGQDAPQHGPLPSPEGEGTQPDPAGKPGGLSHSTGGNP